MTAIPREDAPLAGLRVLDLASHVAPSAGYFLALLGAEVVEVVEPGAANDWPRLAFAGGKVRIAHPGADALVELAARADVLLEATLTPRDHRWLEGARPPVVVRITPFGLTGPFAGFTISEWVAQAAGGLAYNTGDPQFPPVQLGAPIATTMAGVHAATAVSLALVSGKLVPQLIDISLQEVVSNLMFQSVSAAAIEKKPAPRNPQAQPGAQRRVRWQCKDGVVVWNLWAGPGWGRKNLPLIEWMNEHGMGQELKDVPWEQVSMATLDQEQLNAWEEQFAEFFLRFTKAELFKEAARRRILLYPVFDVDDILADEQLKARDALREQSLPDGRAFRFLGQPFRSRSTALAVPVAVRPVAESLPPGIWEAERVPQAPSPAAPAPPLAGIRVLDFSWVVAGPIATKFLGMLGADVVKIETRKRPDASRMTGPFPLGKPSMDGSALFANVSACKRSLGLDIHHERARDLLLRMVEKADIVVENFTAGVLERLGLDYETLRKRNPRVILLRMSLQGQTGPRAQQPGIGNNLQAISGLDELTGYPEAEGMGPTTLLPDFTGYPFGLISVVAGLIGRDRKGVGDEIDLSQYEALLTVLQPMLAEHQLSGRPLVRQGNWTAGYLWQAALPAAGSDSWVAVSIPTNKEWEALLDAVPATVRETVRGIGTPTRENEAAVLEALSSWTSTQAPADLTRLLQAAGIPAFTVATGWDLLNDEQLRWREHYAFPEHPTVGRMPVDRLPFRSTAIEMVTRAAPPYAVDSPQVLEDWLGDTGDEFAALVEAGAIVL